MQSLRMQGAARSTARVWRGGACAQVLEGHGGAVQCVLALPSGDLLTGSNDTTIKLWRGGTCVHTLTGHTDTVRRVPHRCAHSGDAEVLPRSQRP